MCPGTFLGGDDFATVGIIGNVTLLKDALEKRFEISIECVSPSAAGIGGRKMVGGSNAPSRNTTNGEVLKEDAEARLFSRVVRCTDEG
ncbi:hypothetical protein N9L68_04320 [bacterium]|nr:hypothetical protein [bacterium]